MICDTVQEWLGEDNLLGIDIWTRKYQYKDEAFKDWLDRVSNKNDKVKQLILEHKWLPAGRILSNRGLQKFGRKITYSNCYVLPGPKDNIEQIFDVAKWLARTYSYGGGCGTDISNLAPAGAKVRNAAESTTGAVSFMPLYDLTTDLIGQKGRRGALMLSIHCMHPSVKDFLVIKSDLDQITHANISIRFVDLFLKAAKEKADIILEFERPETCEKITRQINAYEFLRDFAEMNWDYAEPGALFWDMIQNWCIVSEDDSFQFEGVNPCAEEPLPAFGSCLLSSFNLSKYVISNGNKKFFDFLEFKKDIRTVVKEMNTILDEGAPLHPLKEQTECALNWRQIGIGVMGIADLLIKLEIGYGTAAGNQIFDEIGKVLADTALRESALLAKEDGSYPNYNADAILKSPYLLYNASEDTLKLIKEHGLRNSQLLTIAPTGTISTMLRISGGVEPIFAFYYERLTKTLHEEGDVSYKVYTKIVKDFMEENGLKDDSELPDYFIASHMLSYRDRINAQSVWQRHIDASISSTINLPKEATVEDIVDLYLYAWEKNLKGITIYREGCKRGGILTTGNTDPDEDIRLERGDWKPLAEDTVYHPKKIYTGCGKIKLMIGYSQSEGQLQDIYVVRSGKGGCERNIQSTVIAMSGMLRLGGNLFNVERAFEGISTCPSFTAAAAKGQRISSGGSCGAAMFKAIKEFLGEVGQESKCVKTPKKLIGKIRHDGKKVCPECGEGLRNQEGCINCPNCGYTKCDI